MVVDDYGHHPTEIRATLEALRTRRGHAPHGGALPAPSLHAHAAPVGRVLPRLPPGGRAPAVRHLPGGRGADRRRDRGGAGRSRSPARGHRRSSTRATCKAAAERLASRGPRRRRGADARRGQRVDGRRGAAAEARAHERERRGRPTPLPRAAAARWSCRPPDAGRAPFLRPDRRTRVRRARRGPLGALIVAVEITGGALVVALLLWSGYARVMASERLKVARVEVRGGRFLSEGEVRELLGPAVGENILGLDIDELKARLRASPWVADATVSRTLPDTLRVEIDERVPGGAGGDGPALPDGRATARSSSCTGRARPPSTCPWCVGWRGLGPESAASARGAWPRCCAIWASWRPRCRRSGSSPRATSGRAARRRGGAPGRAAVPEEVPDVPRPARQLRVRCPEAEFFDLRFRDRIYAKSAPRRRPRPRRPLPTPSAPPPPLAPASVVVPAAKTNQEAAPLGGAI